VDDYWDEEYYEVKFEVENKQSETITFQAREVSADGKMINDSMLSMSQDVSSGKKADAVLTIQNYNGNLPAVTKDFEMLLHVFSWDSDYGEDYKVQAAF